LTPGSVAWLLGGGQAQCCAGGEVPRHEDRCLLERLGDVLSAIGAD